MTLFLDLRAQGIGGDPAKDVCVRTGDGFILDYDALATQIRGKNVLLATHGFNVNREDGINSLGWWEQWLSLADSTVYLGVLWPGDSRWLPVLDYPFEGDEAMRSGRLLGRFLNDHFAGTTGISFASHSLGARMVLETVRTLQRPVNQIVLMAGAIDDDCLIDEYKDACLTAKVKKISLLASRSDAVLSLAFPIGNLLGGIVSRGHPYWHAALGREGPDTPYPEQLQAGWQIPNGWDYGHGDYLPSAQPAIDPLPIPVDIPPVDEQLPVHAANWKSDWAAAFVSTRVRS